MASGFGFSVGDLFLGLKFLKESIDAVSDSKGAAADFTTLATEITCLQDGLEAIQELQANLPFSIKQTSALDRAVSTCQESIDEFLTSISKYQPHLKPKTSGLRSNYHKIKWTVCRKDDIAAFRAQLGRHASAITMLLVTFQAKQAVDSKASGHGLVVKTQCHDESYITGMLKGMTVEQQQFFMIIIQQNKQLLHSIGDLKSMLQTQNAVPPQVLLQQPVILLDPFGKIAPFHMDFIDSSECFMAVLKARFQRNGVTPAGLSKLENGDFLIQDTRQRRAIDLNRNWAAVFRPGQHVDMSMVFHRFACPPSTCPSCLETNKDEDEDEQIHCRGCGLCYQNVQAISKRSNDWLLPDGRNHEISLSGEEIPYILRKPGKEPELRTFRPIKKSEDEFFLGYRRVQVVAQSLDLLDARYPALRLIQDFCRFGELLKGVPEDTSAYIPDIRSLHARAVQHMLQQRSSFPAFASFWQIESVRRVLAEESLDLRRSIDTLVQELYNDKDTKALMRYMKDSYPSEHGRDYYTGVLTGMANLSDFKKSNSPKVRSAEQMKWLLIDSKPK